MDAIHPARGLLAAARLIPANASATVRLDALRANLEAVEAIYPGRGWIDRAVAAVCPGAQEQEDRPPHPFTDRVVGPHGASVVLPGPVQDAVYANRLLMMSLFLDKRRLRGRRWQRLRERAAAALAIAGATSDRAGLAPFLAPSRTGRIVLPRRADRPRLEAAIAWTDGDLRAIEGASDAMPWLASGPRRVAASMAAGWLLEAPELLLAEVNDLIVAEFIDREAVGDLRARYGRAVRASTLESLARLGARSAQRLRRSSAVEAFAMGDDSRILVARLADPFAPPAEGEERVRAIDDALAEALAAAGPHDVALAVGQPLRDPYFDHHQRLSGPFALGMSAADLDVLSRWADRTPLTLLRFARSAAASRERGEVVRFSTLDEFALYLQLGERHPRSPLGTGLVLLVEPGTAEPLRTLVARESGVTAVHPPGAAGVAEAVRRYRTARMPVFVAPSAYDATARVVAAGDLEVWLRAEGGDQEGVLAAVVDSLATALGLLPSERPGALPRLAGSVLVRVSDNRLTSTGPLDEDGRAPVLSGRIEGKLALRLRLEPGFADVARAADNEADRFLLEAVIGMLYELAGDSRDASETVDQVLPIGRKRLVGMPGGLLRDLLGPPDVPPWRPVSEAEIARWEDGLTEDLLLPRARGTGPGALVNAAVELLVESMASALAAVDRDRALLRTVALVESVHREEALTRSRLVNAPLVFGEEDDEVRRLRRDLQRLPRSAVAARFLVECVAATSGTGPSSFTDRAEDELTALAALITEFGFASDQAWLGVSPVRAQFDHARRLTVDVPPTDRLYADAAEKWQRGSADEAYGAWWDAPDDSSDLDERSHDLDAAWREEYGYPLTDLLRLLNAAILLADDAGVSVASVERPYLVAEIAARTGLDSDVAEGILSDLMLSPRESLGRAPDGFRSEDVYPWRFNRAYSYLRRPFVAAGAARGATIVYGSRHLVQSGLYLLALVGGGQLRARGRRLQTLMGSFAAERAAALVEGVSSACRAAGMTVRAGVRKAGGRRLGSPGPDLGDIDVLALDVTRHRVLAIECKSTAAARTPWELAQETSEFNAAGGHLERHERRVAWLRDHPDALARDLDANVLGWDVVGLVVTDRPIPSGFGAARPDIRIIDFGALRRELGLEAVTQGGTSR